MMEKENEHHASHVFLIGLVAVVAVVAVVLSGSSSLEGAPVYQIKNEEFQGACTDNDPDNDFFTLGTTTYGYVDHVDYCLEDVLFQFNCATSTKVRVSTPYQCPKGCLNGFCLQE